MRGVASDVRVSLTIDDDTALANNARYVTDIVPELSRNLQVQKGTQNINVNIVGTTPNYVPVKNYTVTAGRMFTAGEDPPPPGLAPPGAPPPPQPQPQPAAGDGEGGPVPGGPVRVNRRPIGEGGRGGVFHPPR